MRTWILLLSTSALLFSGSNSSAQQQVPTRVLWLAEVPVVINQPGHWVLNRNWRITEPLSVPLISVAANGVTLDLRGYTIDYNVTESPTLLNISGNGVTVTNGRLQSGAGDVTSPTVVHSTGSGTRVKLMTLSSHTGTTLRFDTPGSSVVDSVLGSNQQTAVVAADTLIERTRISCSFTCITIQGRTRIIDSRISGIEPLTIDGDGNYLLNSEVSSELRIRGNWNVVRGNLFPGGIFDITGPAVVHVEGTGNVLEGNIIPRGSNGEVENGGFRFTVDGNFYGNNRVAATVPFDLGGTTQTDWGGNVGF